MSWLGGGLLMIWREPYPTFLCYEIEYFSSYLKRRYLNPIYSRCIIHCSLSSCKSNNMANEEYVRYRESVLKLCIIFSKKLKITMKLSRSRSDWWRRFKTPKGLLGMNSKRLKEECWLIISLVWWKTLSMFI